MDQIKETCFWIVIAQLASAVLCVIAIPWVVLLKKSKQPIETKVVEPEQTYVKHVLPPKLRRQKRYRCSCGKLLSPDPESVIAEKDKTIGIWTCRKCEAECKNVLP